MRKKELESRWGKATIDAVVNSLQNGLISPDLFHLSINGRLDLRGIPISNAKAKATRFEHVDFSLARLSSWWVERCDFFDTVFLESDLKTWRDHGNSFMEVIFQKCRLTDAGLGYKGSAYSNCTFRDIDLRKTIFARAEFNSCEFRDCRFDGVDFFGSSFEDCKFVGKVHDAWFRNGYPLPDSDFRRDFGVPRPNNMKNVDFSEADLRYCKFSGGCDLSSCLLPDDDSLMRFPNFPEVVRYARYKINEFFSGSDADMAKRVLEALGSDSNQDWNIINFKDIAELVSESIATKLRQLFTEARTN